MRSNSTIIMTLLAACVMQTAVVIAQTEDLQYCHRQIERSLAQLRQKGGEIDYHHQPRNISPQDTVWHTRPSVASEWCAGFWSGVLWYDYENTKSLSIKREADRFTTALSGIALSPNTFDHDLGFLIYCSYGNAYRLTGEKKYKEPILAAAANLASLYRPQVGTILSWPRNVAMFGGHNTIIDNMINLELLFWAARNGGKEEWREIAIQHANTTMQYHFRDDYTSYHVAVYDTLDGHFIHGKQHQGFADSTMWARGQAWGIYGFTMCYRETQDPAYLSLAQHLADVFLQRLPQDHIPYWDFDDPNVATGTSPRDVSAACIVASALLELQRYVSVDKQQYYLKEAKDILSSLSTPKYRSVRNPSFLLHSVGNLPARSEIDYSIIYADYYYIEALTRLAKL